MKRAMLVVLAFALLLAGCTHKGRAAQRESSLATNQAVQTDKAQAMKIIQPCLPANQLTLAQKAVRTKTLDCIVPNNPVARAQLEQCVNSAVLADHIVTKAGRTQFTEGTNPNKPSLVACVVHFAGKKGASK